MRTAIDGNHGKYKQPEPLRLSAQCKNGKHTKCSSLSCACPCGHKEPQSIVVIGDVHGHFDMYGALCRRFDEPTVQLGDMGVGFGFQSRNPSPVITGKDHFFRGNHDNPAVARQYANCLGEYGLRKVGDITFFFVAGAWSIDQAMRVEGVSWWRDEELSVVELGKALDLYVEAKPSIVITHDAPESVAFCLLNRFTIPNGKTLPIIPTRTGQALQAMFELHQPKLWVFGHHHVDWKSEINGTQFRCLNELSWMRI